MADGVSESHIADLDRRLQTVRDACVEHGKRDDFDLVVSVIHKPGWTTPQELAFVNRLVDATEQACEHLDRMREVLRDAVVAIGEAAGDDR